MLNYNVTYILFLLVNLYICLAIIFLVRKLLSLKSGSNRYENLIYVYKNLTAYN